MSGREDGCNRKCEEFAKFADNAQNDPSLCTDVTGELAVYHRVDINKTNKMRCGGTMEVQGGGRYEQNKVARARKMHALAPNAHNSTLVPLICTLSISNERGEGVEEKEP